MGDGFDVQELKQNLVALGFDPNHQITINQTFDAATTTAVDRWQASHGATQTGTVTLGQIVFLPGPERITTINTVLGSTGGAGNGGGGSGAAGTSGSAASATATSSSASGARSSVATSTASTSLATQQTEFVSLTTSAVGVPTPAGEPRSVGEPASVGSSTSSSGDQLANAGQTSGRPGATAPCGPAVGSARKHVVRAIPPTVKCDQASGRGTNRKGSGLPRKKPVSNSTIAAALLALLKAEALELKQGRTPSGASGAAGGRTGGGTTSAGGTRSGGGVSGSAGGASRSGGGGGASRSGAGGSATRSGASSGGAGGGSGGAGGGSGGAGSGGAGTSGSGSGSASGGSAAQAILQTTSTQEVVTVNLDATKQSEAAVGEQVTVQLPSGNTSNGKITHVSTVAQTAASSSSSGGAGGAASGTPSATVPITITLAGHRSGEGLDQAAVSVNFQQQKARNVLSVPVTSLLATAGGGYQVQEVAPPHRLIPVTPGLFAAGYVQIFGAEIYPGLQVTDSQG
ncbi:MAG: peptidoglycan-binding domain-containing protein [Solirubrobacteraceae bacterium]